MPRRLAVRRHERGAVTDMDGSVVLITGANSGVGFAAAHELTRRGATILMVCRDRARGEAARARLAAVAAGASPELFIADVSSQKAIRRVATAIEEGHHCIDVLMHNAGGVSERRDIGADGIERTLATNHLAPFLLTHLLLPLVIAAPSGRIVVVASEAYSRRLDFDNLQGERRYNFLSAYSRSKLANILFTIELARRLSGSGVTVNAVSPGPARTRFGDNMRGVNGLFPKVMKRMPFFARPEKAARTLVYAASALELDGVSGRFYFRCKERQLKPIARDADVAARLWAISEELCGIDSATSSVSIVAARGGDRDA